MGFPSPRPATTINGSMPQKTHPRQIHEEPIFHRIQTWMGYWLLVPFISQLECMWLDLQLQLFGTCEHVFPSSTNPKSCCVGGDGHKSLSQRVDNAARPPQVLRLKPRFIGRLSSNAFPIFSFTAFGRAAKECFYTWEL